MGAGDDDGPDAQVCIDVGTSGVVMFSALLLLTLFWSFCAKNKYSRRLFVSSTLMCALELPRYALLIAEEEYTSRWGYISHLLASVFFFMAFTCVIYLLHDAVDLSQASSPLTSLVTTPENMLGSVVIDKRVVVAMNILFFLYTVLACVDCMFYGSLYDFFHKSVIFEVFTILDAVKNLVVGAAFLAYGCSLLSRVQVFYEVAIAQCPSGQGGQDAQMVRKLRRVVRRLIAVMIVCIVAFALRTIMLVVKSLAVEEGDYEVGWMPSYGMLWWVFSDFLPRGIPIVAFLLIFGGPSRDRVRDSTKQAIDAVRAISHSTGSGGSGSDSTHPLLSFVQDGLLDSPSVHSVHSTHSYRDAQHSAGLRNSFDSRDSRASRSSQETVSQRSLFSPSYLDFGDNDSFLSGEVISALMRPCMLFPGKKTVPEDSIGDSEATRTLMDPS
ncbi:hypothetical protein B484DRAFT_104149 [Ochromonadaceae sp. CCMP2298]|nr:hypothetical protein B484DRAFT_104149 [Ochromonadaceae sp. CCMP2298]|mmetsp:Transcript_11086/g.24228  ORF Transcript_11086/g.24228 Transcript_11086/m.24228 type:complete len:440 (+) Transcript_11086:220-1539(+)